MGNARGFHVRPTILFKERPKSDMTTNSVALSTSEALMIDVIGKRPRHVKVGPP